MQLSPPSTQQPSPSLRYTVQDSHRQSPEQDSSKQAVKLTLNQIDFFYGERQSLFKINIEIVKNQVTSFIGPSGCGKSTLLRCLNRLNDLIEGARLDGDLLLDGLFAQAQKCGHITVAFTVRDPTQHFRFTRSKPQLLLKRFG